MSRVAITTWLAENYEVSVSKAMREALGLQLGDIFEVSADPRGVIVFRPKQLTDKPIPEVIGTPRRNPRLEAARRGLRRRQDHPYEQYRAERLAR